MSDEAAPKNGENRYIHIDALRAFAVMLVVVAHAGLGHFVPGGSGVTIFFAVSGFIITFLLLRERGESGSFSVFRFYQRRAIKIAPPFLVVVLIPTMIYSLWISVDWPVVMSQIFFAYNWVKYQGHFEVLPGSEVVWSLAIEEQFYIVFSIVWLLIAKGRRAMLWLGVTAGFAILYSTTVRFLLASSQSSERIYYGSDTRIDGIAWGVLAAVIYYSWISSDRARGKFVPSFSHPSILILAIGIYILSLVIRDEWFRDTVRYTLQAVATCAVILFGLVPGEGTVRRTFNAIARLPFVNLIGAASYSIYLVHLSVVSVLRPYVETLPFVLSVFLLTTVGVGVGILVYSLVEIPAHKFGKALKIRQAKSAQSAVAAAKV
ncbi:acyltransferase family protein [Arthrobacter sp. MDT3-24]